MTTPGAVSSVNISSAMANSKLRITLLADEWKSSKGGLSTMNRELAIQLAKHPNVSATFFVPKCTEDDKKAGSNHNICIVEAQELYGFEDPVDWLSFPPRDLAIDIIIGHGVKLGKQAQVIKKSHHCTWVQVVHTAPEQLSMFKEYSNSDNAISKGDKKQWIEVKLCKIADLVVAVGPKLKEFYSGYLSSSGKRVLNFTPGIFSEFSSLKLSSEEGKTFRVLVFGRGDSEDFELKGFDIAAKAVAELNDRSYQLVFVGAPSGNEKQLADKLLKQGLSRSQLTVKGYLENRDDLATLLPTANLAIIPSRTEGFGLTALEALSAGLPFLVTQNSGFGEALEEIPSGTSWIIDSDDPCTWAEAIKSVREKGRETALKECQALRKRYTEKYSWESQCSDLVKIMVTLANAGKMEPGVTAAPSQSWDKSSHKISENKVEEEQSDAAWKSVQCQELCEESSEHLMGVVEDKAQMTMMTSDEKPEEKQVERKSLKSSTLIGPMQEDQSMNELRLREDSSLIISTKGTDNENSVLSNIENGARPKEIPRSSTGKMKSRGIMRHFRKIHLINCDNTYKLEPVEQLLTATTKKLETRLGIHVESVEKHIFRLAEMSDIVTKAILTLEMDMAFFVVHAHESQLSINEDDDEKGYGKIYRALLQATGGNVIIVIGGDDNYEDEDEEDQEFISRWAKKKLSPQFSEEWLDGRKSFMFSWNKGHRMIHEAALLHHFDPSKKGRKFHYQPPEQKRPPKVMKSPPVRATEPVLPSRLQRSVTLPEKHGRQLEYKWELSPTPKSPLNRDQAVTGQRKEEKLPFSKGDKSYSQTNSTEERRELTNRYNTDTLSSNTTLVYSNQGAGPKERLPPSLEKCKAKDLAILGCNVSQSSVQDVWRELQDIAPKLYLSEDHPPFLNLHTPIKVKEYLMDNHLRRCVLVVDADRIKDAYRDPLQQSDEYQQLLDTAACKVVEKVIILICGSSNLTRLNEENVDATIKQFINKRANVYRASLKNGKLAVEADVLVQFMTSTSVVAQRNPRERRPEDIQAATTSCPAYSSQPQGDHVGTPTELGMKLETSVQVCHMQQPQGTVAISPVVTRFTGYMTPNGEPVMLKSKLHKGLISYKRGDLELQYPEFEVPDYIRKSLLQKYSNTSEAGVKIVKDNSGKLRYTVELQSKESSKEEGIEIADNETLMLNTCVRFGKVSLEKGDLQYISPGWIIPEFIRNSLKREYEAIRKVNLCIISDEHGELRYKVNITTGYKVLDAANKAWRRLTNLKT